MSEHTTIPLPGNLDQFFELNRRAAADARIIDLCYTAFMRAKGRNDEDGGPTDWFNDTKPQIDKLITEMRLAFAAAMNATSPDRQDGAAGQAVGGPGGVPPDGWRLVPDGVTEEMCEAGYDATRLPNGSPQFYNDGFLLGHAAKIYAAMLAAAPIPPATASSGAAVAVSVEGMERYQDAIDAARFASKWLDEFAEAQPRHPMDEITTGRSDVELKVFWSERKPVAAALVFRDQMNFAWGARLVFRRIAAPPASDGEQETATASDALTINATAASAAVLTGVVPAGWKLVPVDPTEEMDAAGRATGGFPPKVWSAMLATAPQPPAPIAPTALLAADALEERRIRALQALVRGHKKKLEAVTSALSLLPTASTDEMTTAIRSRLAAASSAREDALEEAARAAEPWEERYRPSPFAREAVRGVIAALRALKADPTPGAPEQTGRVGSDEYGSREGFLAGEWEGSERGGAALTTSGPSRDDEFRPQGPKGMTDAELTAADIDYQQREKGDWEGGGSPRENFYERWSDIVDEMKRRGLPVPSEPGAPHQDGTQGDGGERG